MRPLDRAIGIFGGTFDPIHLGHLRMALELQESLALAKVHIIPCHQPVHRKTPQATPSDRLAMVRTAVAQAPTLYADSREIDRQSPSYTIDTLLTLREEMPNHPFCLLLGIDAFLNFASWHRWRDILENAHLIVAHRPHYHLPSAGIIAELLKERLQTDINFIHTNAAGGILLRPITQLEISATDIRRQIGQGRNPRYLIADGVYDLMKAKGIYSINHL